MNRVYTLLGGAVCLFASAIYAPAQHNVLKPSKHSIPLTQHRYEQSVSVSKNTVGVPTKKITHPILSPTEAPKGLKLVYTNH